MYKRLNVTLQLTGGYEMRERFLKNDDGLLITINEELAKK